MDDKFFNERNLARIFVFTLPAYLLSFWNRVVSRLCFSIDSVCRLVGNVCHYIKPKYELKLPQLVFPKRKTRLDDVGMEITQLNE